MTRVALIFVLVTVVILIVFLVWSAQSNEEQKLVAPKQHIGLTERQQRVVEHITAAHKEKSSKADKIRISYLVLVIAEHAPDSPDAVVQLYEKLKEHWLAQWREQGGDDFALFLLDASACPSDPVQVCVEQNRIGVDCENSIVPGVLVKTLAGMQALFERYEFQFLIRSNLSSYLLLRNLRKHLQELPTERVYAGHDMGGFVSGSTFILSADLVQLLLDRLPNVDFTMADDLWVAHILNGAGVERRHIGAEWFEHVKDHNDPLLKEVLQRCKKPDFMSFQIRIRNEPPRNRLVIDPWLRQQVHTQCS